MGGEKSGKSESSFFRRRREKGHRRSKSLGKVRRLQETDIRRSMSSPKPDLAFTLGGVSQIHTNHFPKRQDEHRCREKVPDPDQLSERKNSIYGTLTRIRSKRSQHDLQRLGREISPAVRRIECRSLRVVFIRCENLVGCFN